MREAQEISPSIIRHSSAALPHPDWAFQTSGGFCPPWGEPKPAELNRLDVSITGGRDGRTASRPSPAESRHRRLQTRPEVAKQQSKSSDQRRIEAWSRRPKLANKPLPYSG